MGRGDEGLEYGSLEVAGVRRGYWLARGPSGAGPLLVVLHGSGMSGKGLATAVTGLATRGPAAGVTAVFPDGWGRVWHIARPPPGEPTLDDAAFLEALVRHLSGTPVFLAGSSNGGGFAEHVARHGRLPLAGLFLVAGTPAGRAGPAAAHRGDDHGRNRGPGGALRRRAAAGAGRGRLDHAAAGRPERGPAVRAADGPGGDGGPGLGRGQRDQRRAGF